MLEHPGKEVEPKRVQEHANSLTPASMTGMNGVRCRRRGRGVGYGGEEEVEEEGEEEEGKEEEQKQEEKNEEEDR